MRHCPSLERHFLLESELVCDADRLLAGWRSEWTLGLTRTQRAPVHAMAEVAGWAVGVREAAILVHARERNRRRSRATGVLYQQTQPVVAIGAVAIGPTPARHTPCSDAAIGASREAN